MTRVRDAARTVAALVAIVVVGWGAGVVIGHPGFERAITDWAVDHRSGALDRVMPWVSDLASPIVCWPLTGAVVAVLWRRGPRVATTPLVALLGVRLISHFVKQLVDKARPPVSIRLVAEHGGAFPSGHTITAIAAWGSTALLLAAITDGWSRRAIVAIPAGVILAVGCSRVYLGVHWVTDVVGAWVLGGAWLAVLARRIQYPRGV